MITYPGEVVTHTTRAIAHEEVDKQKRYRQILNLFGEYPEMTAKECAVHLYEKGFTPTDERNYSAPRLTELSRKGKVEPIGKTRCKWTGKTVAVYGLVK